MIELTEAESKLIEQIRNLEWGRIEATIQNGKLVMISVKKDIKVDVDLTNKSLRVIIPK